MKCPYCEAEMEQGVIQSPQELSWKKNKKLIARAKFYEDSIVLSKISFLKGSAIISHLCRACERIVIDYKSGICDMNIKPKNGSQE